MYSTSIVSNLCAKMQNLCARAHNKLIEEAHRQLKFVIITLKETKLQVK